MAQRVNGGSIAGKRALWPGGWWGGWLIIITRILIGFLHQRVADHIPEVIGRRNDLILEIIRMGDPSCEEGRGNRWNVTLFLNGGGGVEIATPKQDNLK